MKPRVSLSSPVEWSQFLPPDDRTSTPLLDWELGGINLSDSSQGLQVQPWSVFVTGTGSATKIYVNSSTTGNVFLFSQPYISWVRLAFDQNMHPVVSFVSNGAPYLYWYDPILHSETFTPLFTDIQFPCVTLDDKRPEETFLGNSDVVLSYVRGGELIYCLERDRYGVEYVWDATISTKYANPQVNKIGMNENYRLQLEMTESIYG